MSKTYKLLLNLPLLGKVTVTLYDAQLFFFSRRQLSHYIASEKIINGKKNRFLSNIECDNIDLSKKFNRCVKKNKVLSRDIIVKDKIVNSISKRKMETIHYQWSLKKNIEIESSITYKFIIGKIVPLINNKYSLNHNLFYHLVLFPIFSFYALISSFQLVHGSAVKIKNRIVMIIGLDGVGKSSLTEELTKYGGKVLSDNLTLFNGKSIIPLILPIRIDKSKKTNLTVIFKNMHIQEILPNYTESNKLTVNQVIYLTISEKFEIKKLDLNIETFINQLSAGAKEVNNANVAILPMLFMQFLTENKTMKKENHFDTFSLSLPYGCIDKGATIIAEQM